MASFCLLVAGLSTGVILGELRDELHLSGFIAAAHGAMFGVGLLVVGAFGLGVVARVGRAIAFWTACTATATGVFVLCAGHQWQITLAGCLLSGFACAFLVMLMPGILADHHREHRAVAFAAVNGIPGLAGIGFSLAIGATISAGFTWRWPYAVFTAAIGLVVLYLGRTVSMPKDLGHSTNVLALFRDPSIHQPWLGIVHAVLVEFTVGVFAVVYLKEVGGASGGLAAILAGVWGLSMFLTRLVLPRTQHRLRLWARTTCNLVAAIGVLIMWAGPGLAGRVVGLVIVGLGGGALYPLAVDRLYLRDGADTVTLGAVAALGSGLAVTVGPLSMGILSDAIGIRNSILIVPVLAAFGAYVCLPSKQFARA